MAQAQQQNRWVLGARPRTLPAAVVPVAVGTGVAVAEHGFVWGRALLALLVSLALQVGVNYANDYSDGIRGTDDVRVGPPRLVASKLAEPKEVKLAAFAAFGVAALGGLVLALVTTPLLLLVGIAAIAAGWFYTGGKHPYGYYGFGELFVFTFFGVVATAGSAFVQTEHLTAVAWVASIPVGFLATSMLVINNLRDIPGDTVAGKKTLAVRIGDTRTRTLYTVLVAGGVALSIAVAAVAKSPYPALGVLAAALVVAPGRLVAGGAKGRDLIAVLGSTGKVQLAFGALLTAGLCLSRL